MDGPPVTYHHVSKDGALLPNYTPRTRFLTAEWQKHAHQNTNNTFIKYVNNVWFRTNYMAIVIEAVKKLPQDEAKEVFDELSDIALHITTVQADTLFPFWSLLKNKDFMSKAGTTLEEWTRENGPLWNALNAQHKARDWGRIYSKLKSIQRFGWSYASWVGIYNAHKWGHDALVKIRQFAGAKNEAHGHEATFGDFLVLTSRALLDRLEYGRKGRGRRTAIKIRAEDIVSATEMLETDWPNCVKDLDSNQLNRLKAKRGKFWCPVEDATIIGLRDDQAYGDAKAAIDTAATMVELLGFQPKLLAYKRALFLQQGAVDKQQALGDLESDLKSGCLRYWLIKNRVTQDHDDLLYAFATLVHVLGEEDVKRYKEKLHEYLTAALKENKKPLSNEEYRSFLKEDGGPWNLISDPQKLKHGQQAPPKANQGPPIAKPAKRAREGDAQGAWPAKKRPGAGKRPGQDKDVPPLVRTREQIEADINASRQRQLDLEKRIEDAQEQAAEASSAILGLENDLRVAKSNEEVAIEEANASAAALAAAKAEDDEKQKTKRDREEEREKLESKVRNKGVEKREKLRAAATLEDQRQGEVAAEARLEEELAQKA